MEDSSMRKWWAQVARFALPQSRGLSIVFLLMLIGDVLNLLKPWPLKLIIDYVLKGRPFPDVVSPIGSLPGGSSPVVLLGWLSAGTVMIFIASKAANIAQGYVRDGVGTRIVYNLGSNIFDRLQRLSFRFYGRKRAGDLVRRVLIDSDCVRELVMDAFYPALTATVNLGLMFTVMWKLDSSLALLAIFVAPLHVFFIRLFNRPMIERTYQHEQLEGEMMALAEQTLTAIPVVQAFGREEYEDKRWQKLSKSTLQAYKRTLLSEILFKLGVSGTTALGTAVVMVLGGIHVIEGSLTIGSLIVFISYVASLYGPMETLSYISYRYASAAAKARRVLQVLRTDEEVCDASDAKPLPVPPNGVKGYVRLEGVTFGYEADQPVLQNVTVHGSPGEIVALVGPSGAGKSTLVSLILRLFDPWRGRVTIDGMDARHVKLSSLRANVALVFQEPFLLPLTVAENICYGHFRANREDIVAAAATANAHQFIQELPKGYDTLIGERGATLSGGQKQRLAIARALLKNAPILILDEPTSALDAEAEAQLLKALERLKEGRTTFIIAHRLSTIKKSDRIVFLDKGKVVEMGTEQELVENSDHYKDFLTFQNYPTADDTEE
jgi:ATP-binding cassette subfamily B protein/subfamily B ATP-binding cassette protein MsbA